MRTLFLGAFLTFGLVALVIDLSTDNGLTLQRAVLMGLGLGLLLEGVALTASYFAEVERLERAEIHRGETR